jgi:hypothetical protein
MHVRSALAMGSLSTVAAALALGLGSALAMPQAMTQQPPAAVVADAVQQLAGNFPDGTRWRIQTPPNWNGTLFLDLDGAGFVSPAGGAPSTGPAEPFNAWLLAQGYALGGTTIFHARSTIC